MIATISAADPAVLAGFDDIIDVRSPAEFAEDHVPGAISLPVLDNDERARVGTIYVRQSRFLARRVGAALVARNIARHLEAALHDRPGSWAPLVYCWRGGQRSNAMATVLEQVGWRVSLLAGGYRTYRRRVSAALYDAEPDFQAVLLDGYTGVAKTEILGRLAARGVQTLDLEALAAHRGSLFGGVAGTPQPSQKGFESALLARLDALDRTRPLVIEAESSKVGALNLPPMLWKAMAAAPRLELSAPREARARYLTRVYGDIVANPAALELALARLPVHHGRERREEWRALARENAHVALAAGLIEHHYDPAYERSRRQETRPRLAVIALDDLDDASLDSAAGRIAETLSRGERSMTDTPIRLTALAHGGGCGCKLSPAVLRDILKAMPLPGVFPDLLVGTETADDAAAWRLNDTQALVATTDFFMPVVDDPRDFGRIAATNALSDVYAMGARPILALAIVGMPVGKLSTDTIGAILAGGAEVCAAAGAPIAGGHSIDSVEPIYGLVALGLVHPDKLLRNRTARAGDALILTKALGVGVLSAAFKQGILDAAGYDALIASTTQLNRLGADLADMPGVHAVTDVTGFGLLGHTLELCRGAGLGAEIDGAAPPLLAGVEALARAGVRTGASTRNWESYGEAVTLEAGAPAWRRDLLTDPQTSGGLLIAVDPDGAAAVLDLARAQGFHHAAQVGRMTAGAPRIMVRGTAGA